MTVTTPSVVQLYRLAHALARPVRRGWLTLAVAEVALLLAALAADLGGVDAFTVATRLQATLRRGVQQ